MTTSSPPVLMADSAAPWQIPAAYSAAAVYVNGRYAWPPQQTARFPHVIRISTVAAAGWAAYARVIDVERFDATPADAPAFIAERHRLGLRAPTVYCSRDTMPAVQDACAGLEYRLWVADWTGSPHPLPGAWAVQYATLPGKYDASAVYGLPDFSKP